MFRLDNAKAILGFRKDRAVHLTSADNGKKEERNRTLTSFAATIWTRSYCISAPQFKENLILVEKIPKLGYKTSKGVHRPTFTEERVGKEEGKGAKRLILSAPERKRDRKQKNENKEITLHNGLLRKE